MSAAVEKMAKQYYPRLWNKQRLIDLVENDNKLTAEEYERITGEKYEAAEQA